MTGFRAMEAADKEHSDNFPVSVVGPVLMMISIQSGIRHRKCEPGPGDELWMAGGRTTADNSSDNTLCQGFYHHRMIWPPGGDIMTWWWQGCSHCTIIRFTHCSVKNGILIWKIDLDHRGQVWGWTLMSEWESECQVSTAGHLHLTFQTILSFRTCCKISLANWDKMLSQTVPTHLSWVQSVKM